MNSTAPNTIGRYRANTAAMVPYSFVRKRCVCGKTVTAKQLQLYGVCATCDKARSTSP